MPRPTPQPRVGSPFWGATRPSIHGDTWLESESFCYPHGGMTRRARVRFPDGKLRVVRCGIANTWFSVPVRRSDADGYITVDTDTDEFVFRPHTRSETDQ